MQGDFTTSLLPCPPDSCAWMPISFTSPALPRHEASFCHVRPSTILDSTLYSFIYASPRQPPPRPFHTPHLSTAAAPKASPSCFLPSLCPSSPPTSHRPTRPSTHLAPCRKELKQHPGNESDVGGTGAKTRNTGGRLDEEGGWGPKGEGCHLGGGPCWSHEVTQRRGFLYAVEHETCPGGTSENICRPNTFTPSHVSSTAPFKHLSSTCALPFQAPPGYVYRP